MNSPGLSSSTPDPQLPKGSPPAAGWGMLSAIAHALEATQSSQIPCRVMSYHGATSPAPWKMFYS